MSRSDGNDFHQILDLGGLISSMDGLGRRVSTGFRHLEKDGQQVYGGMDVSILGGTGEGCVGHERGGRGPQGKSQSLVGSVCEEEHWCKSA